MYKVLLLENIDPNIYSVFDRNTFSIEYIEGTITQKKLIDKIKDVDIIGIRSKTKLTNEILEHANKLIVIGCFCIGTNQVDLFSCSKKGIAVINCPHMSGRSVAELVISHVISLARNVPVHNINCNQGNWQKTSDNSFEIRGKVGIMSCSNVEGFQQQSQ